jgi:3'-5' exoribonuclease
MAAERFSERVRGDIPYPLLHVPISEIREGQRVGQCFLVKKKAHRSTRTGDPYLEIVLADRAGTIQARAWAEAAQRYADQFDEGEFVFVQGRTETYRNALQLIVESIRRLSAHEKESGQIPDFDPQLLVPASERNVDEMWHELCSLAESIETEPLRVLTLRLLKEREAPFKEFPAAVSNHHAYVGGLLEHTLEVAHGAAEFAERHSTHGLHHGLIVAGAILHDIGKLEELEHPIAPRYSFYGQLVGHVLLGRDIVRSAAQAMEWPDPRVPGLLEHILISHHGELEYGAAIPPKTAEAIVVYHFDNLSAKLSMMRSHIAADTEEGDFTAREWHLDRRLFKGKLRNV